MGHMKDEWFEYYGEYPPLREPRWHTDRDDSDSVEIAFRPWDEATISDEVDGWFDTSKYYDSTPKTVNHREDNLMANIWDIQDELAELMISKNADYGPKNISESPGGPINGLTVRLYDKVARLSNLTEEGKEPKHEPIRDTFLDIANYAIIGLLVLDGKWEK
jgi:Nucleotide modification associated domain 1